MGSENIEITGYCKEISITEAHKHKIILTELVPLLSGLELWKSQNM